MKSILLLGMLLSLTLFGSEHEVRNLLQRQNDQTIGLLFAMTAIGIHGLIKNSEQICSSDNPYCWKIMAPLVSLPLLGGYLIYKRIGHIKG